MKTYTYLSLTLILTLTLFISIRVMGQEEKRLSPLATVTSEYADTYIKIVYSRPQKKGRKIFGDLVPFNEVWRTGANEATEITFTKDVTIHNKKIDAGTYSLFTIPRKDKWTIILNRQLGLWGSYNYTKDNDILRFDVPTQTTKKSQEMFTIEITSKDKKSIIFFVWDHTKIVFPIEHIN